MKILILSWRDIKSPNRGGAEVFTYENAKLWVKEGHEVILISSNFGNCLQEEVIDGIRIIRLGTEVTVRIKAIKYYKQHLKGRVDIVIDQINTIPFFTPFYVQEPKVALIFQLAREVWFYETFFPLSLAGYILEYIYLKFYTKIPVVTISESTKQDLLNLGFSKEIKVVPVGISFKALESVYPKDNLNPTLVYLGRLRKSKRIHHIIEAIHLLKNKIPNIKLNVIGGGGKPRYIHHLNKLIKKYRLEENIRFHGYLEENAKQEILKKAQAVIITSIREGWGLVVSEANALGTPAVGYNVPGLRDSIKDKVTGLLTDRNNPHSLAQTIVNFFTDKNASTRLSINALNSLRDLTWDNSAQESLRMLEDFSTK